MTKILLASVLVLLSFHVTLSEHDRFFKRPPPPRPAILPAVLPALPTSGVTVNCASRGLFQCSGTGAGVLPGLLPGLTGTGLLPGLTGTTGLTGGILCIPFSSVCNGRSDCPLGEDERNCPTLLSTTAVTTVTSTITSSSTQTRIIVIQSSRSTTVSSTVTFSFTAGAVQAGMTTIQSGNTVCTSTSRLNAPMAFTTDVFVLSQTTSTSATAISASVSCVPTIITPSPISLSVISTTLVPSIG